MTLTMRLSNILPPGDRPIIVLLALIVASGFWSTAATECFALLFLAAVLFQGSAYREQHRSRELRPETLLQLLFWILYVATTLVSFYNAPSTTETLPFHMIWHPLLFPALLMLGVRASEVRVLAVVFVASACLAALAALATFPFSNAQHLEAVFTGDTTFFDLLVLAALASVCLALSGNGRPWIFLLAGLPAAAAVMLSAERAPVVIMLVGSLAIVLATRPRKAFIWAGLAALLLLLSPQALWMNWIGSSTDTPSTGTRSGWQACGLFRPRRCSATGRAPSQPCSPPKPEWHSSTGHPQAGTMISCRQRSRTAGSPPLRISPCFFPSSCPRSEHRCAMPLHQTLHSLPH